MTRRAAIIVLDGLGIGSAPDAQLYGDAGSDTLGNVARAMGGLSLPQLEALGLGNCAALPGITPAAAPLAATGVCEPASPGKDSTTGHWEICGVILPQAFPTYPDGFPSSVIEAFSLRTGFGHRHPGGVWGRALPDWGLDCLHLCRQRLPDSRARNQGPARRTVRGLCGCP